ncbi:MAG: NupC/NupG family nucleoside CNT transporter, partial [Rubrivivax sp.]|nr:NupC/NupG family nucleoside CNT transporter [Rubrivivax sp.]
MFDRARSLLGIVVFLGVAWALCPRERRRAVSWRCVGWGLALQVVLALLVFRLRGSERYFTVARDVVNGLLAHAVEGGKMVFGVLGDSTALGRYFGADSFVLALQSLIPVIVFFAALMAVLYQIGLMQQVVAFFARIMMRFMGTSGAETLSAVGNIFLGMTEAPLMIRPYLERLTRSELFCVMVGGLANSAGTVLAIYVLVLQDQFPNIAGHLLTASVLSAPACLVIAKLMLPETDQPETAGRADAFAEKAYSNVLDSLTGGAAEGLKLALNVIAMLIAAVALIHLLNAGLSYPARRH